MSRTALTIALLSLAAPAAAQDTSPQPITSREYAPYSFVITDRYTGELIDYDTLSDARRAHYDAVMAETADLARLTAYRVDEDATFHCEGAIGMEWTWLSCSIGDFACNVSVSIDHTQVGGCCGWLDDAADDCWGGN